MTDPMPTIENILGFPARTNTPDHRKIAERLLAETENTKHTDAVGALPTSHHFSAGRL